MIERSCEFQVLASHLNFTTAAHELGISQSGLSRHIGELEHELGFRLVDRCPVRLTAAGARYLEGISQVITEVDDLVDGCRRLAKLEAGRLTISLIEAGDTVSLAVYRVLAELREAHPIFEYSFDSSRQMTIEQTILNGVADVGVVYCAPDEQLIPPSDAPSLEMPVGWADELTFDFVFNEPFSVWMHEDNALVERDISFAELSSCTVLLSANRRFRTWADGMRSACERYKCRPTFKTRDVNSVNDFLISLRGNEAVFVSTSCREVVRRVNPRLCEARVVDRERLTYPVYLVYRVHHANPLVDEFVHAFRNAVVPVD